MVITFTKKAGKPHVLTCVREDGSSTWFQATQGNSDFFAAHDLSHFAIETVLGYKTAFYGMVAAGRDLHDFGSENGVAGTRSYSEEALWAENMANLVLQCVQEGSSFAEYRQMLDLAYVANEDTPPTISEAQYGEIDSKLRRLLSEWRALSAEGTLTLQF